VATAANSLKVRFPASCRQALGVRSQNGGQTGDRHQNGNASRSVYLTHSFALSKTAAVSCAHQLSHRNRCQKQENTEQGLAPNPPIEVAHRWAKRDIAGPVLFRFVSRRGILGTLLRKRKEKLTRLCFGSWNSGLNR
jgi:hypothetical protein